MLVLECNNIKRKVVTSGAIKSSPNSARGTGQRNICQVQKNICSVFEEGHSILQSTLINSVNSYINYFILGSMVMNVFHSSNGLNLFPWQLNFPVLEELKTPLYFTVCAWVLLLASWGFCSCCVLWNLFCYFQLLPWFLLWLLNH